MNITKQQVERWTISIKGIDTIVVYWEDLGPRRGKVIVTCGYDSYSHIWGGMGGNKKIKDFFKSCDEFYLSKKLDSDHYPRATDYDAIPKHLEQMLIDQRKNNWLDKEEARDLWDRIPDRIENDYEIGVHIDVIEEIAGFPPDLPTKMKQKHVRLIEIVRIIKKALDQDTLEGIEGAKSRKNKTEKGDS